VSAAKLLPRVVVSLAGAVALTCGSVAYQRRGPELVVVGNLCGPRADELCYAPALKGGFPLGYLYDKPGISVEGKLALVEDDFRPGAFALDVLAYFTALLVVGAALARTHARQEVVTAHGWVATLGHEVVPVGSLDDLRSILSRTGGAARQELWLVSPHGPRLCMLRSGERALLMFLRHRDGDTGFTTRAGGDMPGSQTVQFTLSNEQVDEYPASWTVSVERAREAMEYFFRTGAMAPFVEWSED